MRPHAAYRNDTTSTVTLTIAPFATADVDVTRTLMRPPWADEGLDAGWHITPAQGAEFDVLSAGKTYSGPMRVQLGFSLSRVGRRVYSVAGSADSGVDSGRVELWGYAPGRRHARRLTVTHVHDSAWTIPRLRLPRAGRWELYARYRTTGKTFADDASVCGTLVGVH